MANDEGTSGRADASDAPEEAHIIEEHVVTPTQATPPQNTEVLNAAAPVPSAGPSQAINLSGLLASIKLPERKTPTPDSPVHTFDTAIAGSALAQPDSRIHARTMVENLANPPHVEADIRPLHTLKDDLQSVVRDKKISLVRAVALEEEKRHRGSALEEHVEVHAKRKEHVRFTLLFISLLFAVGLFAIGAVLFVMSERTPKGAAPITAAVLFSEQSVPLPIGNLSPADIRREIGNARNSAFTLGAIVEIVPVLSREVDGQTVTTPARFGEFLEKIGAHAPQDLVRSLTNSFFLGIHTVDENAPLIVVPVTSYERAFAAMLAWEKSMNADLSPMFTPVPPQTLASGMPVERAFEDTIMRNYDVRALKDDSGTIQLYYSFPTRSILIIAESPYSFAEILSRLKADRKL